MDFDSCFVDCCKSCNSTAQKYRSPTSGQGDCKCGGEIQEQNFWVNADKEKKFRSRTVREKEKPDLKEDKSKKLMDGICNCFAKTNKKQEGILKHEVKQEKNDPEIFENCSNPWNNFISNNWKSKMERFYVSEERKYSDHSSSEKLLTENVLELEEKVDFLLRVFKDCGYKLSNDCYLESMQTKGTGTFGDAWHLFNLNKRLCAAEEGIEKLALILEELVKESSKKKVSCITEESVNYSEPLGFNELTMGQRINFLKNRNDILLSLIRTFLKSSSVEEICSRLSSQGDEFEPKPSGLKLHCGGKNQSMDLTRDEIIETLKNLQVSDAQPQKKTKTHNEHLNVRAKREYGLKYPANTLEVISEQAELALSQSDEGESLMNDFQRKNGVRNLKGKFSQVSENGDESAVTLCDVTSRLLAQEAMLKSSLDKVHLELFSKLDSPDKNFLKANLSILNSIQMPAKEENNNSDEGKDCDCSSDFSCTFCEGENMEKPSSSDPSRTTSKCTRYDEYKEPIKEERNSFGTSSNTLTKDASSKKTDEQMIGKNKQVFSFKNDSARRHSVPAVGIPHLSKSPNSFQIQPQSHAQEQLHHVRQPPKVQPEHLLPHGPLFFQQGGKQTGPAAARSKTTDGTDFLQESLVPLRLQALRTREGHEKKFRD